MISTGEGYSRAGDEFQRGPSCVRWTDGAIRAVKKVLVMKRFKWMSYCDFGVEMLWSRAGSGGNAPMRIKVIYLLRRTVGSGFIGRVPSGNKTKIGWRKR